MPSRVLALFAGSLLGLVALWASLWVLLGVAFAATPPNPFVLDGDPCCSHPDTWAEVRLVALGALLGTGLVASVLAVAVGLLAWGVTGRACALSRLALGPGGAVLVMAVTIGGALIAQRGQAVAAPDCGEFRLPGALAREERARQRQLLGLVACDTLDGAPVAAARRLLGARRPDAPEGRVEGGVVHLPDGIEVLVRRGRVASVRLSGEPAG